MSVPSTTRPTRAVVDSAAIEHNVRLLSALAPEAQMCAVVKADGYGHGAVAVAEAALRGGAARLAVATVDEAVELRTAGIDVPIMLLSEPPTATADLLVRHAVEPTVYTRRFIEAFGEHAGGPSVNVPSRRLPSVHLKVNTGMNRVGASPADAVEVAASIVAAGMHLASTYTHLATADEADRSFTEQQLERFAEVLDDIERAGIDPGLRHAANSAATIAYPAARLDLVRCGIAIYGISPSSQMTDVADLRAAMRLESKVSFVKTIAAGEAVSYGQRYRVDEPTVVATVPVGYADGVPRRLSAVGGDVLIGGLRRPIAGTVTMDQITVDCGPPGAMAVGPGDEVVLIGTQGDDRITAEEWAAKLDTIGYEVVCGVSARVPREVRR